MKPFKTFNEQLNILKNEYNLEVLDEDSFLIHLETISYNELIKTYKDTLLFDGEVFLEGVTGEGIFQLYHYDKTFQNILMKFSIYAENALKTKLSYIISKKFGTKTDVTLNYFLNSKNKKMVGDIEGVLNNSTDEPINHYRNSHKEIPPWILYKNLSFSTSISIYRELLETEKKEIINSYIRKTYREHQIKLYLEDNPNESIEKEIDVMLTTVRYFRNTIAHNGHFCKYKSKYKKLNNYKMEIFFGKSIINKSDFRKNIGIDDAYSFILSLYFLLANNELRKIFIREIISFLGNGDESIREAYITILKLPSNIIERLEKLHIETEIKIANIKRASEVKKFK